MTLPRWSGFFSGDMAELQQYITTKRGISLHVLHGGNGQSCPPLQALQRHMSAESSVLLPTTPESMQASYEKGLAVVLTSEQGEAVGYLRFSVLLDAEKKERLGLQNTIPDVLEIGSAYIHPDFRGGVYSAFRNEALSMVLPAMQEGHLLVLGTTKAVQVLHAADHAKEIGINFKPVVHTDYDMIAPLTCVCQGCFGRGMQSSSFCPRRITIDQLPMVEVIAASQKGKIPCTMYVSDEALAERMNHELREHFRSRGHDVAQRAWIEVLREDGHYA